MNDHTTPTRATDPARRDILRLTATGALASLLTTLVGTPTAAAETGTEDTAPAAPPAAHKAFVYTELQISLPFEQAPWRSLNPVLLQQPGLLNKTWLAGVDNHSLGGFYAFDSIENAQRFVTGYFPDEARRLGVAQTTRVFDATVVEAASRDMNSVHFGAQVTHKPGAFLYTEIQVNVPFDKAPWRDLNPVLKRQPGLLHKTWLSGLNTQTVGGFYAFDTIDNARAFALNYFPTETKALNAAFYTRIFDAAVVETASRQMHSPFFVA